MLFLYGVLVVCCAILLISGIVEQRRHFTNLERIPTRVLINGIRGKSSITRLCAGALRGGDLVTVAKTTGTAARFIHPDATEEPVYRKFGIANVVEQIGIVRRAASYNPDALVIECMAVMPALQEINQSKLIRSTIGVLCNVREDHLAEMGPTLDDVARSLCRSMPEGGICVTAEQDRFHILQEEADARDCKLIYADPETVSDEELRGFSWFTFKENVAIALTVAELLGVDRQTALQGMYDAPPDPGVLSVERYRTHDDKRLRFANVFAANDPESTLMNINQLLDLGAIDRPLNVVINCRPDRVERNGQMGQIIPDLQPEKVFVIGHPAKSAIDAIPSEWRHTAVDLGGDKRDPEEFMNELLGHLGPESSLVAIGNIHGQGELLLEHLAELPADETPDEVLDEAPGRQSAPAPAGTAPAPEAADATDPAGNPADNPVGTPTVSLFPPVPTQRQQSPQPQPQQASHPQQPQQEQQSRQQPRHDETLALPRYTPHIDPYQPYPEAYEARYQQPPRPQPHPQHQPQSHAQSHAQSHPQNQHEPSHRSPETPAEQPPAAPRVRGLFEPVLPPAPAEEDPARQEHPAQQEYPGEPR
ncbi:poly-gamma-glutamate synthase PgsB [Streptomyces sp. NBC_00257]|uniref:poly-gamma-glutamate synthase PgsB n=1 Tax=unclassified Streptomyces TaxID=2593676 RepID=UPI0022557948|nr:MULTISPECIES: poly-gamma-glutamate synthase PgsB [unclassified Streptomyces]WTB54895.1 poly-gamma-glutamate synthase PgsB [Streptomyces sp. NBC_00826]WTH92219.1 poly-gamma-glutamate synthase PgsB [Streptomyces sp. NBC_00825]WTI00948.1 poly-gamma-glutamate synthase PgsB [Streptomyces sp. NBC_00822]MCX4866488.1 poly-gamma-glutamate synthase PgsB [Streptomyces sp. NBC_00906]MCX4897726.1 poly-gamma-glutamate synthase PgsB [Streptomyces sp. NBC_00892]